MQEYFEIGQIVNTSGLKGIVKANLFMDDITRIEDFKKVLIEENKKLEEYEIEEVKYHKNQALIKFKGIDDIDNAERLRNCLIKIRREDEEELPEDTYYIVDLIGLEVFSDEDEKLGTLKDVFSVPSGNHDIYVVETGEKDLLLPAIGDVIKQVDIKNNKIIVHLIEGLR
ncbi:MAG: 16S rRNA processing protein RimM [Clostridia bacterium]|nr:16S rRNA processing protein RimM [Clostridia bacterium]